MKHEDFIVSMKGIQKSFGGVHALTDGELTLRKGEVLGLIGENGAGKKKHTDENSFRCLSGRCRRYDGRRKRSPLS